ncbi:MAG TPA: hypothetical protein VIC59_01285 [Gemmatimonadota bacterium]
MRPRTSDRLRQRGAGPVGCLLRLILLGAVLYVGFQFAAPHVQAWRFEDAMKAQAEAAEVNSDQEIRAALLRAAHELQVPLDTRALQVTRARGRIEITAEWTRDVVLPKYRRVLHFQRSISAPVDS